MLLDVRKPHNYLDVAVSLSKELADANNRNAQGAIPDLEIERLRESGLLALVIPQAYGGVGATWVEALKIVRELSEGDALIGQLYGNHLSLTVLAHVSGTPEQKERYYRHTAQNNSFWANAINTWDTGFKIIPEGENFRLNGAKNFDTVVAAADLRVFSAVQDGMEEPFFFIIPSDRESVISNNEQNNFGHQTNSSSFTFKNVLVKKEEVLASSNPSNSAFCTFLGIIAQLTKTHVQLGVARSALEAAQEYGTTVNNSWSTSGMYSTKQDPYASGIYNNLWIELNTAIRLADQVADMVQVAWEKEFTLTHEEREEVAIAVFSAEAFATRIGLDISNCVFELIGTPTKDTKYSFERYWRDLHSFGGISMPWKGAPQHWKLTSFSQQRTPC